MKILIVTDAWYPQVNGVVRTLDEVGKQLTNQGHDITYLTSSGFKTFAVPSYPEIRLAWNVWKVPNIIRRLKPEAIHIATPEGPLGIAARCYCVWHKVPYTSSYHTKLPEYIHMRYKVPVRITYEILRWCHMRSQAILVTTESMKKELQHYKFARCVVWTRGADDAIFNPSHREVPNVKALLYAGRVSIEKNIQAFLQLDIPNTNKIVVGDGPQLEQLKAAYPDTLFLGYRHGVELAEEMASADVFVFPSKTDTFGIVMVEAAYCGTPIAAYPVTGPIDFVKEGVNGSLDEDLSKAIEKALQIDRNACFSYTKETYSWEKCAKIFLDTLAPISSL